MSPICDKLFALTRDRSLHNGLEAPPPCYLVFEVTTRCNLRCVMCPHGIGAVQSPRDAADVLVKDLWEFIETTDIVHLNSVGEPLLAGPFWRILRLLKGRKRPGISINTNGHLLSAENAASLFEAPLHTVSVSLDAARPETYRRLRGADFRKAIRGIEHLVRARDSRKDSEARLGASMVLMEENIRELTEFIELAAGLGLEFVSLIHLVPPGTHQWLVSGSDGWEFDYHKQQLLNHPDISDRMLLRALEVAGEKGITILSCNSLWFTRMKDNDRCPRFELGGIGGHGMSNVDALELSDCPHPWEWLQVRGNGDVLPCLYAQKPVGNIVKDGGVKGIWNGPELRRLRKDIIAGRLNRVCAGTACPYPTGRPKSKTGLRRYTGQIVRWFSRQ